MFSQQGKGIRSRFDDVGECALGHLSQRLLPTKRADLPWQQTGNVGQQSNQEFDPAEKMHQIPNVPDSLMMDQGMHTMEMSIKRTR